MENNFTTLYNQIITSAYPKILGIGKNYPSLTNPETN